MNKYLVVPDPEEMVSDKHYFNVFGNNETEISAGYIVRYCQKVGNWDPFTYEEINELYSRADGFTFNLLIEGGWIIKEDDLYYVTFGFLSRIPRKEKVT